jgi:23S rRNA pseudouridine1911/1915/1917 synthase
MIKRYIVTSSEDNQPIKEYLFHQGLSDNALKDIKTGNGQILVNDMSVMNHFVVHTNDIVDVVFSTGTMEEHVLSTNHPLEILYEDSYLLVLNKEPNVATLPTGVHYKESLANYVMCYYKRMGINSSIHFISRLDAPTSGIIVLAKNGYVASLMKQTNILKKYLLEVEGTNLASSGVICGKIDKCSDSAIKRYFTPSETDESSKTIYRVLNENNSPKRSTTFVEATLCTGKTHQLRLHFESLHHPIVGDELYGEASLDHILRLHSYQTSFLHPITNNPMLFETYPNWLSKEQVEEYKKRIDRK